MLADRFGRDGQWAWSLCNGIDHSPVVPLAFEESVAEHTSLPFHSSSIRGALCRCGHSPQQGLRPTGHEGQVCRRGTPPLRGLRLA